MEKELVKEIPIKARALMHRRVLRNRRVLSRILVDRSPRGFRLGITPLTHDDTLWNIVGLSDAEVPSDLSSSEDSSSRDQSIH